MTKLLDFYSGRVTAGKMTRREFMGKAVALGVTAAMATITPVATFFFFDILLKITLPKGLPIVEETIFYPLYKIFL